MNGVDQEDRVLTIEEYATLDEPDGYRTELVRGRIVKEPRPAAPHGWTQALLAERLVGFVRKHDLGVVFVDVGVVVDPQRATVRGPDLLFVSTDRLPSPPPKGFLEVAPDLAVEIVSPGNSASEIQEKIAEYLEAGCRLVWIVDPDTRTAAIYGSGGGPEIVREPKIVREDDELDGGEVLPGLRIRLSEVLPEE